MVYFSLRSFKQPDPPSIKPEPQTVPPRKPDPLPPSEPKPVVPLQDPPAIPQEPPSVQPPAAGLVEAGYMREFRLKDYLLLEVKNSN